MTREFKNYVTLYGASKEAHEAVRDIVLSYEKLNGEDGPEILDHWRIGTDTVKVRLDPFRGAYEKVPDKSLSELSQRHPNVVIEWSYCGNYHDFYCSVLKNGCSIAQYEALGYSSGEKLADKSYYMKALRLVEMNHANGEEE